MQPYVLTSRSPTSLPAGEGSEVPRHGRARGSQAGLDREESSRGRVAWTAASPWPSCRALSGARCSQNCSQSLSGCLVWEEMKKEGVASYLEPGGADCTWELGGLGLLQEPE